MAGNEKCPHLYVTARKMGFSLLALDKHSSLSEVSWGAVGELLVGYFLHFQKPLRPYLIKHVQHAKTK